MEVQQEIKKVPKRIKKLQEEQLEIKKEQPEIKKVSKKIKKQKEEQVEMSEETKKPRKKVYTFIQAFKEWKEDKPSESKMMLCPKKGSSEYEQIMEIYKQKRSLALE